MTMTMKNSMNSDCTTTDAGKKILCPSSKCDTGSILLGIVKKDGRISFVQEKILVDKEFVKISHGGRKPEKRFRFASECIESGCGHWKNGQCRVINEVIGLLEEKQEFMSDSLPACSIRSECRWFQQRGAEACRVCPEIITDVKPQMSGSNE